jgi:hypothetical protein
MPRYAEFGINTFVGSPAQGEAYASSPTPRGFFSVLAWFDFESPGCAVFELRVHLVEGVKDVLRRGRYLASHCRQEPTFSHICCNLTTYFINTRNISQVLRSTPYPQTSQRSCFYVRSSVNVRVCGTRSALSLTQHFLYKKRWSSYQRRNWALCNCNPGVYAFPFSEPTVCMMFKRRRAWS